MNIETQYQIKRIRKFALNAILGLFVLTSLLGASGQAVRSATDTPSLPPPSLYGVEMESITPSGGLQEMAQANAYWIRRNALIWADIQPVENAPLDWSAASALEAELQNAATQGMQVVLIVRGTPAWAQKVSGYLCGPVKTDKLAAFASFMKAAVQRYSASPYNVKYWELWNEPDIAPSLVDPDSLYGCWGDVADENYGGGYYAKMLKEVYPQVKAADPSAQVLVGGLLLDCDTDRVCPQNNASKFLEGILLNKGGDSFDGVSFHAYDYYFGSLGRYGNQNWISAWNTTGPVALAKAEAIRSLLAQYGLAGKYLVDSEAALLCQSGCGATFETTKAYYVAQSYASALAVHLKASIWYSARSTWQQSNLLNSDLTPTPAYDALKFSQSILHDAVYLQEISQYPGVTGYEFKLSDRRVWLIWSQDGNNHTLNFLNAPLAAHNVFGQQLTPAKSMTISLEPVYLEWPQIHLASLPVIFNGFQSFRNGDFEQGSQGWSLVDAGLPPSLITAHPAGEPNIPLGSYAALLGNTGYPCSPTGVPIGYAAAEQTFTVPAVPDGTSISLDFKYVINSQDASLANDLDRFEVYIDNQIVFWDGNQVNQNLGLCQYRRVPGPENPRDGKTTGWARASIDLTSYRGQNVLLSFRNYNRKDGWYNTYTYLDDVKIVIGN